MAAIGARRRFSSFATHTYLTLACYKFGEWSGNKRALALAKASTRTLIELQGPRGEWPWFFYTPGRRVVDWYEVYSSAPGRHGAGISGVRGTARCSGRHRGAGQGIQMDPRTESIEPFNALEAPGHDVAALRSGRVSSTINGNEPPALS